MIQTLIMKLQLRSILKGLLNKNLILSLILNIFANTGSSQAYLKINYIGETKKNRIIIKRKKEILVRFQQLTVKNAESFFYQQLLFNKSVRNENELKDDHPTYRSAFQHFYPREYTMATQD